jgi:hypothetical protein
VNIAQDGQVEAQVAVGDPVLDQLTGLGGQRLVDGEDLLLLDQAVQQRGQGAGTDRAAAVAGRRSDIAERATARPADGFQDTAGGVRAGELRGQRLFRDGE